METAIILLEFAKFLALLDKSALLTTPPNQAKTSRDSSQSYQVTITTTKPITQAILPRITTDKHTTQRPTNHRAQALARGHHSHNHARVHRRILLTHRLHDTRPRRRRPTAGQAIQNREEEQHRRVHGERPEEEHGDDGADGADVEGGRDVVAVDDDADDQGAEDGRGVEEGYGDGAGDGGEPDGFGEGWDGNVSR